VSKVISFDTHTQQLTDCFTWTTKRSVILKDRVNYCGKSTPHQGTVTNLHVGLTKFLIVLSTVHSTRTEQVEPATPSVNYIVVHTVHRVSVTTYFVLIGCKQCSETRPLSSMYSGGTAYTSTAVQFSSRAANER